MVRVKKNISDLSIKQRGVGKCALERVKYKENARAIALAARHILGAVGNTRIMLVAASFILTVNQFVQLVDWYPVYHAPIESRNITVQNYVGNCWIDFRFRRCHLGDLCLAFGMTDDIILENRSALTAQHGFLFLLNRIASLKTLVEHETTWGRDYSVLGRLYNHMIDLVYNRFSHLLIRNMAWFQPRFALYNIKVIARIVPPVPIGVARVAKFGDASLLQICRPQATGNNNLQVSVYNGKDKVLFHVLNSYEIYIYFSDTLPQIHLNRGSRRNMHTSFLCCWKASRQVWVTCWRCEYRNAKHPGAFTTSEPENRLFGQRV